MGVLDRLKECPDLQRRARLFPVMRDHGISDVPDPNEKGGFGINAEWKPGSALDLGNPRFNDWRRLI